MKKKNEVKRVLVHECKFDETKDFNRTEPGLDTSIREALVSGVVQNTLDTSGYSGEKEVSQVGHYLREPMDCFVATKVVGKSLGTIQNNETKE